MEPSASAALDVETAENTACRALVTAKSAKSGQLMDSSACTMPEARRMIVFDLSHLLGLEPGHKSTLPRKRAMIHGSCSGSGSSIVGHSLPHMPSDGCKHIQYFTVGGKRVAA